LLYLQLVSTNSRPKSVLFSLKFYTLDNHAFVGVLLTVATHSPEFNNTRQSVRAHLFPES